MEFIRSPEKGLCAATSFAMALGVTVAEVLEQVGDWKEVIFPGLPEPMCWRGIHQQELIRVALRLGYAVTPVELFPTIAPACRTNPVTGTDYDDIGIWYDEGGNWCEFMEVIETTRGILEGYSGKCGHMTAYDHGNVFDPSSLVYPYSYARCTGFGFYPHTAWRIDKMEAE